MAFIILKLQNSLSSIKFYCIHFIAYGNTSSFAAPPRSDSIYFAKFQKSSLDQILPTISTDVGGRRGDLGTSATSSTSGRNDLRDAYHRLELADHLFLHLLCMFSQNSFHFLVTITHSNFQIFILNSIIHECRRKWRNAIGIHLKRQHQSRYFLVKCKVR